MTTAFILVAGQQARLANHLDHPKALLRLSEDPHSPWWDVTFLHRTVGIARASAKSVVLVAPGDVLTWQLAAQKHHLERAVMYDKGGQSTILERIWTLMTSWHVGHDVEPGACWFLLGDVVYSKTLAAMMGAELVLGPRRVQFFGRSGANPHTGKTWGEVYSLIVPAKDVRFLAEILLYLQEEGTDRRLWDLVEALGTPCFTEVSPHDFTDDIDTEEDLRVVLPRLRALVSDEGAFEYINGGL